jgi:hypothetical protein
LNFVWTESSLEVNCSDCSFVFRHDDGELTAVFLGLV